MTDISSTGLSVNSQILSQLSQFTESISETDSTEDTETIQQAYAEEGDAKYDEDMDEDGDGVITYEEYSAYMLEAAAAAAENSAAAAAKTTVSKTTDESGNEIVAPINGAKALSAYTAASSAADSFISTEVL